MAAAAAAAAVAAAAAAAAGGANAKTIDLFIAARDGKIMKLNAALKAGADVNYAMPPSGTTPLRIACEKGHLKIVDRLLKIGGVDINKADRQGITPLLASIQYGKNDIAKRLIQAPGINLNTSITPIYLAAFYGRLEIVIELLKNPRVDVNKGTPNSNTMPLQVASQNGYLAIVNLLLEVPGINVNSVRKNGATAISFAAENGHTAIVNRLLEVPGIDLTSVLKNAKTGRYKAEINKAILDAAPKPENWQPATRTSVSIFDTIFDTEAPTNPTTGLPTGARPVAVDTSTCPVCFTHTSRSEACNYMKHDCSKGAYYHSELYNKFKNSDGMVYWCTICGRICLGHRHYELSDPADKRMPNFVSYTGAANFFANDCKVAGGGGLEEKFKRYRRAREVLKGLDASVSFEKAMDILVEEMWRAPLAAFPMNSTLAAMRAAKKFTNIPTESFPVNLGPDRILNPFEVILQGKKYLYTHDQVFEIKTVDEEPNNWNFETYKGALAPAAIQTRFRQYKIAIRPVEKFIAPLDPSLLPKMVTLSEPIMNPITLEETDKILHFKHSSGAHASEIDVTVDTPRVEIGDFFGMLKVRIHTIGDIGPCWKETCTSRLHPDEVDEALRLAETGGGFSAAQLADWRAVAKRYRELYIIKFGTPAARGGATGGGHAAPAGGAGMPAGGAGL